MDSLVVSALQDAIGYAISRKITSSCIWVFIIELFYVGMPVVRTDRRSSGRSVGVRSRDYQSFSDG